jgi:hypothetical protein
MYGLEEGRIIPALKAEHARTVIYKGCVFYCMLSLADKYIER